MPESMSVERRRLMSIYGAEFVNTPRKGMNGAIESERVSEELPNAWLPLQFDNRLTLKFTKLRPHKKL
jgi:cysteine synthase A